MGYTPFNFIVFKEMTIVQSKIGIALKSTALIFGYTLLYVVPRCLIKGAFEMETDDQIIYTELQVLIIKTFFVIGCIANVLSIIYTFIMGTNFKGNLRVVLSAVAIVILFFEFFIIPH
jgi:hypothetical protein